MNRTVQFVAARPWLRYPLVLLAYPLACALVKAASILPGLSFEAEEVMALLFPVWMIAWIVLAVRDRRTRMIWRQLFIWLPGLLVAALCWAMLDSARASDWGLLFLFVLWPVGIALLFCLAGSIAAIVQRPNEEALRPTQ